MSKKIDPFNNDFVVSETDETGEKSVGENQFIIPNIETKLPKHKRDECREIVLEVRNFGVSQRQLLYLIHLLSLELENVEAMRAIAKAVGEVREFVPVNVIDVPENKDLVISTEKSPNPENSISSPNGAQNKKKLIL